MDVNGVPGRGTQVRMVGCTKKYYQVGRAKVVRAGRGASPSFPLVCLVFDLAMPELDCFSPCSADVQARDLPAARLIWAHRGLSLLLAGASKNEVGNGGTKRGIGLDERKRQKEERVKASKWMEAQRVTRRVDRVEAACARGENKLRLETGRNASLGLRQVWSLAWGEGAVRAWHRKAGVLPFGSGQAWLMMRMITTTPAFFLHSG